VSVPIFEFGDFRLDPGRFELLREGRSLKLERKPMELLLLLVEANGRLVTRTEIARKLWDSEVFVDTEHGINTAIRKIRFTLRDDPESPRFIQTVPGKGYRFVTPLTTQSDSPADPARVGESTSAAQFASAQTAPPLSGQPARPFRRKLNIALAAAAALSLVLLALTIGPHPLIDRLLHRTTQPTITSIAVLPLENLSGDPSQDYFADGMTDELITMLAKNSTLRITSRTSVMQYKGVHKPLIEIASALGVDSILEGSVSRTPDKVHLTLQLIRADTDTHLWAESYNRDKSDVAALPNEAAQAIALELHSSVALTSPAHSVSPEAHDAYLRGRYFLQKREADKSAAYFQQAIAIDPSWSDAYAGLAAALQSEGVLGMMRPEDSMTKGEAAARHAIVLDPQNGEAYSTLGLIQAVFQWEWTDAEENLKHGIALSPSSSDAELHYAIYLDAVNRPEEAVIHMRRALQLDPASFLMNRHLGSTLYFARHYDEALAHLQQALEMEPGKLNFVAEWASRIYEMKGMRDKAVESDASDMRVETPQFNAEKMFALYKHGGWNAYWEARMKTLLLNTDDPCAPYDVGVNYIRLGKPNLAFPHLAQAIDEKCWEAAWIMVDPMIDRIRSDQRYSDLLNRLNLPH
jgi:TolB-like protein/DNA-binding winged helix-turn-helix (wHTH) protein